ncbi:MAG: Spy/CpxP family protein refolding chaperone [Rhodoferax sp.]|uniref:Spy/CpxP family protein refolding chaperone n=1 Tax=Rhodoferax sp. TaxID=50421 RepID=UPI002727B523|nr:Spy/CpxP family protein refolding chaperone [Rhodoferax sp.]MDO8447699.1 Spy/CpxP family protein refolding chaperone [Rhodoferax sp.]
MKPWIKRTLIGLFGAAILAGGLTACGHRPHGFGATMSAEDTAQRRAKMVERVSSKLELNADQKQRLTVLADKLQEQRIALMGQTKDPRADVKALVAGDKFDKARAQALVTEKTTALQSKSPEVITALADFYDSLNPAQQQKVRDFMEHRGGRWFRRG